MCEWRGYNFLYKTLLIYNEQNYSDAKLHSSTIKNTISVEIDTFDNKR